MNSIFFSISYDESRNQTSAHSPTCQRPLRTKIAGGYAQWVAQGAIFLVSGYAALYNCICSRHGQPCTGFAVSSTDLPRSPTMAPRQDVARRADRQRQTVFQHQSALFHPEIPDRWYTARGSYKLHPCLDYHCHGTTSDCSIANVDPTPTTVCQRSTFNAQRSTLNADNADTAAWELLCCMEQRAQCSECQLLELCSDAGRAPLVVQVVSQGGQRCDPEGGAWESGLV